MDVDRPSCLSAAQALLTYLLTDTFSPTSLLDVQILQILMSI